MRKLISLMAGLSSRDTDGERQIRPDQGNTPRKAAPGIAPDCAIWNDIARALEAKPRDSK